MPDPNTGQPESEKFKVNKVNVQDNPFTRHEIEKTEKYFNELFSNPEFLKRIDPNELPGIVSGMNRIGLHGDGSSPGSARYNPLTKNITTDSAASHLTHEYGHGMYYLSPSYRERFKSVMDRHGISYSPFYFPLFPSNRYYFNQPTEQAAEFNEIRRRADAMPGKGSGPNGTYTNEDAKRIFDQRSNYFEDKPVEYKRDLLNLTRNGGNSKMIAKAAGEMDMEKKAIAWRDMPANAIDWYLNKLNTTGILPVNVAAYLRSVNAKQLGSSDFVPREMTGRNFTDAEADALLKLTSDPKGGYHHLDDLSYNLRAKPMGHYGDEDRKINEYFSPVRSISTSIGRASVDEKGVLHDTYDFNKHDVEFFDNGDGTVYIEGTLVPKDKIKDYFAQSNGVRAQHGGDRDFYPTMRNRASRYAHNSSDPDKNKIKFNVSLDDLKRRLGDRLGKFDIYKAPSIEDLVNRGTLAGGITGAGLGALLGLAGGGASLLLSRNRRRKWIRTLALGGLLGAGAVGAAGALTGRGLSKAIADRALQTKKASETSDPNRREKKKTSHAGTVLKTLALAGLAGGALYGGHRLGRGIYDKVSKTLLSPIDQNDEINLVRTDDPRVAQGYSFGM